MTGLEVKRYRTREEWRNLIEECEVSEEGVSSFCEKRAFHKKQAALKRSVGEVEGMFQR